MKAPILLTRARADLVLLGVALIWGVAFLFQKQGAERVGVMTFVAARFAISALITLPLFVAETGRRRVHIQTFPTAVFVGLCLAFVVGVLLQHLGILLTSITNAGFLTGLYVLFTALVCRFLFKQAVSRFVFLAALLSVLGAGVLSGGLDWAGVKMGDMLIGLCALAFGFQVALLGRVLKSWPAPFAISFWQYAITAVVAGILAMIFEKPDLQNLWSARWAIFYAGVISGGIAYTLQAVAQRFTPASDSAVIMSLESVFAAFAGVVFAGEKLSVSMGVGAALILTAILLVEFGPRRDANDAPA